MGALIQVGAPLPDFTLDDLDGRRQRLAAFRGRAVVINFWSAECPWSERVDRELTSHLPAWDGAAVLICIACNLNEPVDRLRGVAAERGLPLVLVDADQQVTRAFGVQTTPHFFVADRAGILRYEGGFDDRSFRRRSPTQNYLFPAVAAALAGKSPAVASTSAYGCAIITFRGGNL